MAKKLRYFFVDFFGEKHDALGSRLITLSFLWTRTLLMGVWMHG